MLYNIKRASDRGKYVIKHINPGYQAPRALEIIA